MNSIYNNQSMLKNIKYTIISTIIVYVVTSIHHVYGAIHYETPFRLHIVFIGFFFLITALLFLLLFNIQKKGAYFLTFILISLLFFGLAIGVYEGGYNHLLSNILSFAGIGGNHVPDSVIFESTGILQFFAGLFQIKYSIRCIKDFRMKGSMVETS